VLRINRLGMSMLLYYIWELTITLTRPWDVQPAHTRSCACPHDRRAPPPPPHSTAPPDICHPCLHLRRAAAGFLEEGSLDTRTHAKRCLWAIRGAIPGRSDWERLLGAVAPEALQRKVLEVLDPAAGCPAFPANRGTTGGGPAWGWGVMCVLNCPASASKTRPGYMLQQEGLIEATATMHWLSSTRPVGWLLMW
jgi:hypothetical protein